MSEAAKKGQSCITDRQFVMKLWKIGVEILTKFIVSLEI